MIRRLDLLLEDGKSLKIFEPRNDTITFLVLKDDSRCCMENQLGRGRGREQELKQREKIRR